MKLTKKLTVSLIALSMMSSASAATIVAAGFVEGSQVGDWRTAATAKGAHDIDGDNIFGSFGSVQWGVAGLNEEASGSSTPGWAFISSGALHTNSSYVDIDNSSIASEKVDASIALFNFTFEMTGVPETYAGMTVRVGVMQDVLGLSEAEIELGKTLQLIQTVGGTGTSSVVSVRDGSKGDSNPEMYFFDITGVNPGDQFQVLAPNGGTSGYVGAVTWDIAAVPEPSSAALIGLGGIALILRRRK